MINVEFRYNEESRLIICQSNETCENAFQKFKAQIGLINDNKFIFLYDGRILDNKEYLGIAINDEDRKRNKMIILAIDSIEYQNALESEKFMCPKCPKK